MKAGLTEDLPNQQAPKQKLCGNLPLLATVSRILKIAPKSQTPRHKMEQTTWRRPAHFFLFFPLFSCCFAKTNSWTLAANTSLTASCRYPALYLFRPLRGNALHMSPPLDHVGQGPSGMPFAVNAPASRLSTTRITTR